jgi:hypothetical protein
VLPAERRDVLEQGLSKSAWPKNIGQETTMIENDDDGCKADLSGFAEFPWSKEPTDEGVERGASAVFQLVCEAKAIDLDGVIINR